MTRKNDYWHPIKNTSPEQFHFDPGGIVGRDIKSQPVRLNEKTWRLAKDVKKALPTLSSMPITTKKVKIPCINCGISSYTKVDPDTRTCFDIETCEHNAKSWK